MTPRPAIFAASIAFSTLASSATLLTSERALADESPEYGEDFLDGFSERLGMNGGTMLFRDAAVTSSKSPPPVLADADFRLHGGGSFVGGVIGFLWVTKGFRFSLDESFYGPSGAALVHNPLGGVGVSGSKAYGFEASLGVGKQFYFEGFFPYVEVHGGLSLVALQVSVDVPGLGSVGQNDYKSARFLLAPRVGIVVPLARALYLDTSAGFAALGHQGVMVQSMLGFFVFNPSRW